MSAQQEKEKTLSEKIKEMIKEMIEKDPQKIGGLTLGASARLGMEELRQAVSLDGSVADQTQTPLGMYGTLTPGEVSEARQVSTKADSTKGETRSANAEADPVQADLTTGETRSANAEADPVQMAQKQAQATKQRESRDHGASR